MVRRILLRITYVGKERLIEAPTDLPIGRLAEIVGRAIAPTETDEEGLVRYELCVSGVPVAENERVGRVCALLQPGQALQLRIVRERTSPPTELGTAPKGEFYSATWILGGRAVAVAGEWGCICGTWRDRLGKLHPLLRCQLFKWLQMRPGCCAPLKEEGLLFGNMTRHRNVGTGAPISGCQAVCQSQVWQ